MYNSDSISLYIHFIKEFTMGAGLSILHQAESYINSEDYEGQAIGAALGVAVLAFKDGIDGVVKSSLKMTMLNEPPTIVKMGAAAGSLLSNPQNGLDILKDIALDTDDASEIIGEQLIDSLTEGNGVTGAIKGAITDLALNHVKGTVVDSFIEQSKEVSQTVMKDKAKHKALEIAENDSAVINSMIDEAIEQQETLNDMSTLQGQLMQSEMHRGFK